jgi:hypothetical protein
MSLMYMVQLKYTKDALMAIILVMSATAVGAQIYGCV